MGLSRLGRVLVLTCMSLALAGCKTTQPGVRSTMFTQYTTIAAGTADATDAAESVLNDLGLKEVESQSTNVDGWAKGRMADNTLVKVSAERVDDKTSNLTVRVGSLGDTDLGKDIIARVRDHLGIEPPVVAAGATSESSAESGKATVRETSGGTAKAKE